MNSNYWTHAFYDLCGEDGGKNILEIFHEDAPDQKTKSDTSGLAGGI